jgi:hypothetical protein
LRSQLEQQTRNWVARRLISLAQLHRP